MRKIWLALLILTSLITGVFLVKMTSRLSAYFSLDSIARADTMQWKIVEKDPSSFALEVSYRFKWFGEAKEGVTQLSQPYFLNAPSAEKAAEEFSKKKWDVFYNKKNPAINSLQKNFPFKDCFQFVLTLGVFIYFLFFKKIIEKSVQEW